MTVISQLPTPPSRKEPVPFAERTDAFLGALPGFVTETNAVASEVNADKVTAVDSAATAVTKAAEAALSADVAVMAANITRWVSGTLYTAGDVVWSPINIQAYRRITSGSGTTDPSQDRVNWRLAIDDGITTLVLDKDREVQIYSNETNKQFSIMTPNRTPFLYSEDGVEWEMSDGLAKNLTGDAYVSGISGLGVMSVESVDSFWHDKTYGACFLNGYLYAATTAAIYQYSFPNGVLINSVAIPFAGNVANLISDGSNLIVLSDINGTNNQAIYAGGDLSSVPTISTRVYPQRNVGRISGFYAGNLYQHFYSNSLSNQYPTTVFNADGTKYYYINGAGYPTIAFNLSTPYDLTTAEVDRLVSMEVPTGVYADVSFVRSDGLMFYEFRTGILYQYSMSTAFNFAGMVNTSKTLNLGSDSYAPTFKPDGTKVYYVNTTSDRIRQITLSTPWDLATAGAYVEMVAAFSQNPTRLIFAGNGLVAYVYVSATEIGWHKVNFSVAWDVTTAVDAGLITTSVSIPVGSSQEYEYSNDGTMIYVTVGGATVGYTLSTPWLLETAGVVQTLIPTMVVMDVLVKYDGVSTTKLAASPLVENALSVFPLATNLVNYSGCINADGDVVVAVYNYGAVVFEFGSDSNMLSYNWKYVEAASAFNMLTTAHNPSDGAVYGASINLLAASQYTVVKFGGPSAVLITEELI